jgi:hypothetical protein
VTWDNTNNYFVETDNDNVQHTKERCLAFKEITKDPNKKKAVETMKEIEHTTNNQNHKQITLEMVQRKLESIGIIINVEKLIVNKYHCIICDKIIAKYSLVSEHIQKHVKETVNKKE